MGAKGWSAQVLPQFARGSRVNARQLGNGPRHAFGPTLSPAARALVHMGGFGLGAACAVGALLFGGCGDGQDAPPCTTMEQDDGSVLLHCPDGSEVVIHSGIDGTNGKDGSNGSDGTNGKDGVDGTNGTEGPAGPGCNATDKVDHTVTIVCGDGPVGVISDGTAGSNGTSCTVQNDGAGGKTIACTDGTSVAVADGVNGSSCSVANNNDGTHTISCTDGTIATVLDGHAGLDGSNCSVADNHDGTLTMHCQDGSSVTWNAPRSQCSLRFEDAYHASSASLTSYYASAGVVFSGDASVIGGVSQDALASGGVEGTVGPAAALAQPGAHEIDFTPGVRSVALDFIRGVSDEPGMLVRAWHTGAVVTELTVDLTVAEPLMTVRFEGFAIDSVTFEPTVAVGLDNVRYDGVRCPAD